MNSEQEDVVALHTRSLPPCTSCVWCDRGGHVVLVLAQCRGRPLSCARMVGCGTDKCSAAGLHMPRTESP